MHFEFQDKHVLITGGSQGIGLGIAEAFRQSCAHVIITGTRDQATDYQDDLSPFT